MIIFLQELFGFGGWRRQPIFSLSIFDLHEPAAITNVTPVCAWRNLAARSIHHTARTPKPAKVLFFTPFARSFLYYAVVVFLPPQALGVSFSRLLRFFLILCFLWWGPHMNSEYIVCLQNFDKNFFLPPQAQGSPLGVSFFRLLKFSPILCFSWWGLNICIVYLAFSYISKN